MTFYFTLSPSICRFGLATVEPSGDAKRNYAINDVVQTNNNRLRSNRIRSMLNSSSSNNNNNSKSMSWNPHPVHREVFLIPLIIPVASIRH